MKPTLTILGARGTMPVSGRPFLKYGGHTTCFCLTTGHGKVIIDAGTGLALLGENAREQTQPATLLFTHFHLDHVIGLPFFRRLYNPAARLRIMADSSRPDKWRASLANLIRPPYWPLRLKDLPCAVEMRDLPRVKKCLSIYGARISWCRVIHPQGCLAYRIDAASGSAAIVTDHEQGVLPHAPGLLALCRGCDSLIYDAQYLPGEIEAHRGWGHGTWREAVALARAAGAGELILTHHDVARRDEEIDRMVGKARRHFKNTSAAHSGMIIF
ncbi:MAG: MBL fold metallo-hydrolase [Kiritimatiellia bacterium]